MEKINKSEKEDSKKIELEYPMIDLDKAIELIRKAYSKGKDDVMTFDEINKHMGIKGGSRSIYTNALRLYGLIEKTELGWQITEIGKRVASSDIKAIASAFLMPQTNKLISDSFRRKKPTLESLIAFLKKQKIKGADVIAKRYLRGLEYVHKVNPFFITLESERAIFEQKTKTQEVERKIIDKDVYMMAIKVGQLFKPTSQQEIKTILDELLKMAEKNNMKHFSVIIKSLKEKSETLKEEEMKKEFEAISQIAIKIFENELE